MAAAAACKEMKRKQEEGDKFNVAEFRRTWIIF